MHNQPGILPDLGGKMKYLKIIGLAAAAAMALMAFGVGTASATTLENGTSPFTHPTVLESSLVGSAILETTGGTTLDTCTESTVSGNPDTGSATATVKGAATVTFNKCTKSTTVDNGGELEIHHIAGTSNGTVTGNTFDVTVEAFEGTYCAYGLSKDDTMVHVGTLTGDDHTAKIEINTVVVEVTTDKFLCPNDARWTATYHITNPTGLTVTAG
jgi:hypothetical protein